METKNYSLFKMDQKINRRLNPSLVKKLKVAIVENDLSSINPIIVNENYKIIDGQHRFVALKELKKKIYYIQKEGLDKKEIAMLNNVRQSWSIGDYINIYIDIDSYSMLRDFIDMGFSSSSILEIDGRGSEARATIKEGLFKFSKLKHTNEIVSFLYGLDSKVSKKRAFVRAYMKIRSHKYTRINLLNKKLSEASIKDAGSDSFVEYILGIYNFGLKNRVRISDIINI